MRRISCSTKTSRRAVSSAAPGTWRGEPPQRREALLRCCQAAATGRRGSGPQPIRRRLRAGLMDSSARGAGPRTKTVPCGFATRSARRHIVASVGWPEPCYNFESLSPSDAPPTQLLDFAGPKRFRPSRAPGALKDRSTTPASRPGAPEQGASYSDGRTTTARRSDDNRTGMQPGQRAPGTAGLRISFCTRQLASSPTNSSFSFRQSSAFTRPSSFGSLPALPNRPAIRPSSSSL